MNGLKAPHGFPVVGIGASAGGLPALKAFFEKVPVDSGMAFVVIVHLSKDHESVLDKILQGSSKIPVQQVTEKVRVEPNHVYVIPPTQNLTMIDGEIGLIDRQDESGKRMPVDLFFRTLGEAYGKDSYAVVLSGSGNDGTLGIERVKEVGGVTLAQDPGEAEFGAMPANAIATHMIDVVLPAAELAEKILLIYRRASQVLPPAANWEDGETAGASEVAALRDILSLVRIRTGHDFSNYKRPTLLRRVARRLQVNDRPDMGSYLVFLREHPEEVQKLLRDLLITVTNFFRDKEAFRWLEDEVIPKLFANKTSKDTVRVWSCGCGTGEEAYALAIQLHEFRAGLVDAPKIQVFASDINEDAIRVARQGVYSSAIAGDVSAARLQRFFIKKGEGYGITKELRDSVLFAPHNVLRDPPFSQLDLIACRNLLIYFNRDTQGKVMELFSFALNPGGHLFLGSSEGAEGHERLFGVVDKKFRIFRNVQTSKRPLSSPASFGIMWEAKPSDFSAPPSHTEVPLETLHLQLASRLAPPSVLLNDEQEILHTSEGMDRFMQFASGSPTRDLLRSLHPSLQLDMRAALMTAKQENQEAEVRNVRFKRDEVETLVNLTVQPVSLNHSSAPHYLAVFDEHPDDRPVDGTNVFEALSGDSAMEAVVRRLEEELQKTRERLRLTTEHGEVATEELKASNEELQAINEELRSATEELETSKEELQSLNEEMVTVNLELNDKVEEISRNHADLENLMHSTDIGTIFLARDLTIKRFTRRVEVLFNIIESDIGRPFEHLTHKFDYPGLTEDAQSVLRTLVAVERELHVKNSGQSYLARLSPYRTTEDRIEGVVISFVEISQLKLATDALRRQETQLAMAQEVARAGVWTLDLVQRKAWCSSEYLKLHYMETGSMEMTKEDWIQRIHPNEVEEVRRLIQLAVRERGQYSHEFRVESGREERWVMEIGRATYGEDGEGLTMSGISVDITERVKLREEMLRQKKEERARLVEASQRKDEFLALLAHELRTPLSPVRTGIEILKNRDLPPEEADKILQTVEKQTAHMVHLIDDLLDISRVTQGKLNLRMARVDLKTILHDAVEATKPFIEEKQHHLSMRISSEVLTVFGDESRLLQVFSNLINNAAKYTPPGGEIVIHAEPVGDDICVTVEDDGEGIDAIMQESIFELFGQVSHPDRVSNGLGIGLSLVRSLIERHEGSVTVQSEGAGLGSRFTVRLPALHAAAVAHPELVKAALESKAASAPGYRKILVVDDSPSAADILVMFLEMEGYETSAVYDGPAALAAVVSLTPDLVFLDIGMPGISGYDVARQIRKMLNGGKVTLVALTGWGQESDRIKALDAGFDFHLTKPVSPETIRKFLSGKLAAG